MKNVPGPKSLSLVLLSPLLLFAGVVTSSSQDSVDKSAHPSESAITSWLTKNAIPLKSVEPGQGFQDLKAVKRILRNVRVVGLGEATHGSHEFFQFKHCMTEFLVREMGFTLFAIEASYPASLAINDYVLYGKGDRDKAITNQGLWAWDTAEMTDLVEWMRKYNQTAPVGRRVKFVGFDMHNSEQAMDAIIPFLKKVAPDKVAPIENVFKPLRPTELGRQHFEYANVSARDKADTLLRIDALIGYLFLNQTRFIRLSSAQEFEQATEMARIVAEFADVYNRPDSDSYFPGNSRGATRDRYMAENIERAISAAEPNTRAIVWAHNDHIGCYKFGMGANLRKVYGEGYYALGTSFNEGGYQARELSREYTVGPLAEFSIGPAPAGTINWYLARPGIDNYLIDFRYSTKSPVVAEWLETAHPMRSIGLGAARNGPESLLPTSLKDQFDGIAFIEKTTRAHPNPTGFRGPWIIKST